MVFERNFLGADAGIFRQNEVLMKKIPLKRIFAAAALVCCLTVTTAYADVTQEDIDNAKNQINNLKNQQKDAQDAVDDINGKKGELESDLNNLNGQMTNIVSSMNALESQINDKKKELSDLINHTRYGIREIRASHTVHDNTSDCKLSLIWFTVCLTLDDRT